LAEQLENFVGVKHSSYDLLWQTEVRILTGSDFRILVGVEELSVPMLAIGADGLVNAAANVAPALIVEMFDIVMSGDLLGAREIHNRLYPLNSAVFYETNPVPVKYMMKRIGLLDSNEHRPPLASPPQSVARRLDEVLVKLNLLVIAD
jgi:4-hydroxy-tetrahydrodipicolinate synthase